MNKKCRFLCVFLSFLFILQLFSTELTAFAADGAIYVNSLLFDGSLSDAISSAGAGGIVEIEGTVYTQPVGKRDGCLIENVTICGKGDNAQLILAKDFVPQQDDNLDVLSVKGNNVTIKDLIIDSKFFVDYAICVFCGTDNITVDNVTVLHGMRGGINLMTGGNVIFRNVAANDSYQCGFELENCGDCSKIIFENCTTSGNIYNVGLIIKNGYGPCTNLDASGLTCYEDCFAFHDRVSGTIYGEPRQELTLKAPPKNSNGEPVSLLYGVYFPLEKAYHHIRFGADESEKQTAKAKITTSKYGFDTVIYYDDAETAQAGIIDGDVLEETGGNNVLSAWIIRFILLITRLSQLFS